MTDDDIWDWQCRMHVYSCYLYEVLDRPLLEDWVYDQHCIMLLRNYAKLPSWYTERITEGQLRTASGSGIKFTPDDIQGAHEWVALAGRWSAQYGL